MYTVAYYTLIQRHIYKGGTKMITVGALFTGFFVVLVIGIMIAGLVTLVKDNKK